ncbi:MAG: hypothetical protein HC867_09270 [Bacteroidia bacterium]|nr:hypothetical protein [Bacteroidia bacterium]
MMKLFYCNIFLIIFFSVFDLHAQEEDLLKLVGEEKGEKEIVKNAFKSPRVINGHSMEFFTSGYNGFQNSSPVWPAGPGV